jgi:hypothetical protein
VDLTTPAKKKENDKSEFSGQKVHDTSLCAGLKFASKIAFTKPDFL